jgi:hypothetical protein
MTRHATGYGIIEITSGGVMVIVLALGVVGSNQERVIPKTICVICCISAAHTTK